MARITSFEIAMGRKQTKDYNSTEYRLGLTVELEEGDDVQECILSHRRLLKRNIREFFNCGKLETSTTTTNGNAGTTKG